MSKVLRFIVVGLILSSFFFIFNENVLAQATTADGKQSNLSCTDKCTDVDGCRCLENCNVPFTGFVPENSTCGGYAKSTSQSCETELNGTCRSSACLSYEADYLGQANICNNGARCCIAKASVRDGVPKPRLSCSAVCDDIDGCTCSSTCPAGAVTVANGDSCDAVTPQNQNGANTGAAANNSSSVFGLIEAPTGVSQFTPTGGGIGLFNFISMLIRILTVIAGIITFFNFIISGYTYVTSDGNAKANETVRNRLTYSILGLVLIVSAYTIIALVSLIIFGDATYILNPTITPPGLTPGKPAG